MKENDIIQLATRQLMNAYPACVIWKSPSFKHLSWDIFGIYDLVVVTKEPQQVIFIQVTSLPNLSARRKKIQSFFGQHNFGINNSFIYAWDKRNERFAIEKL